MRTTRIAFAALALSATAVIGCGSQEAAVETPTVSIETPAGDVEVATDEASGDVSVDVTAAEEKPAEEAAE